MTSTTILWAYIALLVAGGFIGFFKAKSKISLIMSLIFAALLTLCNLGVLPVLHLADILITVLLVIFGIRYAKTKKFIPSGLMAILSVVAVLLRNV